MTKKDGEKRLAKAIGKPMVRQCEIKLVFTIDSSVSSDYQQPDIKGVVSHLFDFMNSAIQNELEYHPWGELDWNFEVGDVKEIGLSKKLD